MNNTILAERIYQHENKGLVKIKIKIPTKVEEELWECSFIIEGLDIPEPHQVHGIDAFQVLMLVFGRIALLLEPYSKEMSWWAGEKKGDLGIYRYVMSVFGSKFEQEMIEYMKKKEIKHGEKLKKKAELKLRKLGYTP